MIRKNPRGRIFDEHFQKYNGYFGNLLSSAIQIYYLELSFEERKGEVIKKRKFELQLLIIEAHHLINSQHK